MVPQRERRRLRDRYRRTEGRALIGRTGIVDRVPASEYHRDIAPLARELGLLELYIGRGDIRETQD
jgi:hypothetical protein